MPPPVDLTGRRFGDLTVVRKVGVNPHVRRLNAIWLCHCERCGRNEEMIQQWIPYNASRAARNNARWSCSVCFRGPCEICGGENISGTYQGVCSEACHHERQKQHAREFHYRRLAENPDYYKEVARAKRKALEADPEKMEAFLAKQREKGRLDHAKNGEAINAKAREAYHRNRDHVLQQRREKFAALPEEERIRLELEAVAYRKDYWAKNRDHLIAIRAAKSASMTAEQLQARRAKARASRREKKAREALDALMRDSKNMMGLDDDTTQE